MKSSNMRSGRGAAAAPTWITLNATATAAGAALLCATAGLAQAQQAAPAASEGTSTVVVTGIRRGIEGAISVKKNANNIVDAISAEDIGKLPDVSIAESISRLPGVTAQRTAGRASQISIRGMGPDFSTALLNGREQVTTGDSRGVEFDQYPSELLSNVDVYKSPDGGLIGQGLSGTVDMRTVRPLDAQGRTVAVNLRKQRTGVGLQQEGDGYRFSLAYIDQFADRKLGVALGFARFDEDGAKTSRFDSWGSGTTSYQGQTVNVPYNGFGIFTDQTTQTRDGAMAVLQYRPNKQFSSTLDLFYSKFDKVKATKGFQAPLNDSWSNGNYDTAGVLTSATLNGTNVTQGTFNNVRGVVRNDSEATNDKLQSIGWNNKFVTGAWTLAGDLSHSSARRRGGIIETTAGVAQSALGTAPLDTLAFTNAQQFTPAMNYTDRNVVKLTDVQGWGGGINSPQAGYSKLPNVKDELNSIRLSAKRDLPEGWLVSSLEGGVNFADRSKTRAFVEGRLVILGGNPLGAADIPGSGVDTVGGIAIPVFDPSNAIGSIYEVARKLHPDIYNKDWTVDEKVTTLFVKGDIDSTLWGKQLRGNVGLQVVNTDQSSRAFNVDRGQCSSDQNCPADTNTAGAKYTDILPSLNLALELGNDQVLRFALARAMARPTLNDMRASFGFSVDNSLQMLKGDAGNPLLKPTRANALDLTYEKYFGTKAYFAAAAFYKDLRSYVLRQDVTVDFTPYVNAGTALPPGGRLLGLINMPINSTGGDVKGLELAASMPLNMAAKWLDGFGIEAKYADISSSVNLSASAVATDGIDAGSSIPLPGLSRKSGAVTVYFEKWGFSARVARKYRSNFIGEVSDFAGDRRLTYVKGEGITDLQLGYEVQGGFAKGLSVLFQAYNLGNTEYVRYRGTPDNIVEKTKYGKTYLFGLNYKL